MKKPIIFLEPGKIITLLLLFTAWIAGYPDYFTGTAVSFFILLITAVFTVFLPGEKDAQRKSTGNLELFLYLLTLSLFFFVILARTAVFAYLQSGRPPVMFYFYPFVLSGIVAGFTGYLVMAIREKSVWLNTLHLTSRKIITFTVISYFMSFNGRNNLLQNLFVFVILMFILPLAAVFLFNMTNCLDPKNLNFVPSIKNILSVILLSIMIIFLSG